MKGFQNDSIWKWTFPIADRFSLPMPNGARVLTAQMQRDEPCIWAEVNQEARHVPRHFRVVGTGNPIPAGVALTYVTTFQQGQFVWHLYEEA